MTPQAFREWWDAHLIRLTNTAEYELEAIHCQDAEVSATQLLDKLQEYLTRICERLEDGAKGSGRNLWYLTCAAIRRRARNHMRDDTHKHGVHTDYPLEEMIETPEGWQHLLTRAELTYTMDTDTIKQQHVRLVLAALTLKDRDILLSICVEGYTVEEMSKQMGYAHRTGAQMAIKRAMERFRVIWYAQGYGGDIPRIASGGCRLSDSGAPPPVDPGTP